jgi:hypothetical protein
MNNLTKFHSIGKILYDVLRDNNSDKYSATKFASFTGLILFAAIVISGIIIMLQKHEIDHVLIVETIGFILTLLGFKNNFGFNANQKTGDNKTNFSGNSSTNTTSPNVEAINPETSSVKEVLNTVESEIDNKG